MRRLVRARPDKELQLTRRQLGVASVVDSEASNSGASAEGCGGPAAERQSARPRQMHAPSRLLLLLSCALASLAQSALADEFVLFPFDPPLTHYLEAYRQTPNPQEALDRLLGMDMEDFQARGHRPEYGPSRAVLMAFFAHVLHENPQLVLPFAGRVGSSTRGQLASFCTEAVAIGASAHRDKALSLIGDSFGLADEDLEKLREVAVFPYPQLSPTTWEHLDILWASYYASGDLLYVRKIAQTLEHFIPPDDELRQRLRYFSGVNPPAGTPQHRAWVDLLTAQAAARGLRSHASSDAAVHNLLEELASTPGRVGDAATWNLDHLDLRSHFVDQ
jgi:hypothetical protein